MSDQFPAARPGFRDRRSAAKAAKRDRKSRWKAEKLGAQTAKAAFANARAGVRRMSRAERGAIGHARLTRAHLAEMATQHVAGHFDDTARSVGLSYEDTARRLLADAGGPDRIPQWNPAKMVRNAASRWADVRRGTKELRAGYAMARNEVDRMDPTVLQTIGDQRMTAARLQYLAEQGMRRVITGGPSTLAPEFEQQGAQQPAPIGQQQTQQVPIPQEALLWDRIQRLELQVEALRNQVTQLQALQAQLEQQAQVTQQLQPEGIQQRPEAAQAQPGAAQQQPEGAPEQAEGAPGTQEAGAQEPAQHGPDPNKAQNWVDAAAGETPVQLQPPAGSQEAGREQPEVAQPANAQGDLSPADMQNMHVAFRGLRTAQPSNGQEARETAAAAEKGLHKAGQGTDRQSDSLNR